MVFREGHYYGVPFKGSRGVTRGNPMSLTIFNMVVDAFICHWVTLVSREDAALEGFGRAVKNMATLFHVDNRLLASPLPESLKDALDVLTRVEPVEENFTLHLLPVREIFFKFT